MGLINPLFLFFSLEPKKPLQQTTFFKYSTGDSNCFQPSSQDGDSETKVKASSDGLNVKAIRKEENTPSQSQPPPLLPPKPVVWKNKLCSPVSESLPQSQQRPRRPPPPPPHPLLTSTSPILVSTLSPPSPPPPPPPPPTFSRTSSTSTLPLPPPPLLLSETSSSPPPPSPTTPPPPPLPLQLSSLPPPSPLFQEQTLQPPPPLIQEKLPEKNPPIEEPQAHPSNQEDHNDQEGRRSTEEYSSNTMDPSSQFPPSPKDMYMYQPQTKHPHHVNGHGAVSDSNCLLILSIQ